MAITYVDSTQGSGAAASSFTAAKPTGTASGDVLVATQVSSGGTPQGISGFTQVYSTSAAVSNPKVWVGIRVADGSEGASFTFNNASAVNNSGMVACFRGVDNTTPQDTTATTVENATAGTSMVLPSLTTTVTGVCLVATGGCNSGSTDIAPPTAPGTWTEDEDTAATATRSGNLCHAIWSGSGATGTVTMTLAASRANAGALLALRPASGGTNHTQSPTDAAGLGDSRALAVGVARTDQAGLGDSVAVAKLKAQDAQDQTNLNDGTVVKAHQLTVVETMGLLSDSSTRDVTSGQNHTRTPSDQQPLTDARALAVGLGRADQQPLADTAATARAIVRTFADNAGVTDTAQQDLAGSGAVNRTDPVGLADARALEVGRARADALPLTDAGTAIDHALAGSQPVGLTDSFSTALGTGHAQAPVDQAGLTDSRSLEPGVVRADALGLGDAVSLARGLGRADALALTDAASQEESGTGTVDRTDPVGLGDSVALTGSFARSFADLARPADSVETSGAGSLTRTDQAGLSDAASTAASFQRAATDQTGLGDAVSLARGLGRADSASPSDTVSTTGVFARAFADTTGLDDALETQGSGTLSRQDSAGVGDSVTLTGSFQRAATDTVGLGDTATVSAGRSLARTDSAGLSDAATVEEGRTRTDTAGLGDTLVLQLTKAVVDSAGLDDEFTRLWNGSRALADAAALVDTVFIDLQLAFVPVLEPAVAISQPRGRARLAEPYATARVRRNRNTIVPTPEE